MLNKAVKEMMLPGVNAADYIGNVVDEVVEKYRRWLKEKGEHEEQGEEEE